MPALEHVFTIEIELGGEAPLDLGDTARGKRRMVPITGGHFSGPVIRGQVLAGGYDWQLLRSDGVTEIDARYLLRTEGGSLITIVNTGTRFGPPEVMHRLQQGERVEASAYYFRTHPRFECADPVFDWLNRYVFVGSGTRLPDRVIMEIWKVN